MSKIVHRLLGLMATNSKSFIHCLDLVPNNEIKQFNIAQIFIKPVMDGLTASQLENLSTSIKALVKRGSDINQTTTINVHPEGNVQIVTLAHLFAKWGDSSNPIFDSTSNETYRDFIRSMTSLGMSHDTYDRDGRTPYDWACSLEEDPNAGISYYKELMDALNLAGKLEAMMSKPTPTSSISTPGDKI